MSAAASCTSFRGDRILGQPVFSADQGISLPNAHRIFAAARAGMKYLLVQALCSLGPRRRFEHGSY